MEKLAKTIELQKKRMGVYEVEEEKENTLEQMIKELNESSKRHREESKTYYEKIEKQLAEHRGLLKYTLSEQEKQRISSMSMSELLAEIQKNIEEMKISVDKILDKDSKNVKEKI
ncbi:hypothetical protein AAK964_05010 [Tissierella praeacuta]|uniref:hypothetical protein n=1 Tax=Tissierella praeacuta TaxID=43131 RepID=UPI003518C7E0